MKKGIFIVLVFILLFGLFSCDTTNSSLKYHVMNAKKNGVSLNELTESLTHIAMYVGWPKVWATLRYVKEVYTE